MSGPEKSGRSDLLSRAEGIVRLRQESEKKTAELVPALFLDMFGDPAMNPKGWRQWTLGELLSGIDSGQSPKCHDRPVDINEWGVLRLSSITRCFYDEREHKTLPLDVSPDKSIEVRSSDVLLSRKNTYELVGACAYVWKTNGRMLLPDLIFRLNIADSEALHPLYLWAVLTSPSKRKQLRQLASGSAGSMPNISKQRLRTLAIPVPSQYIQRDFADRVDQIQSIQSQHGLATAKAQATFDALMAQAF